MSFRTASTPQGLAHATNQRIVPVYSANMQGAPAQGGAMIDYGDKRQAERQPVLKAAKIICSGSVIDCLVLDISPVGVRITTEIIVPFPEEVQIELRSGGIWSARRRWQRGTETGFEFTGFAGLRAEAVSEVSKLYDKLRNSGIHDIAADLVAARYFDHPELKASTDDVANAVTKLEEALRVAAGRSKPM